MSEYTRMRPWESRLLWLWDVLENAERGRTSVTPDTLSGLAVEAVKAHLADARPGVTPRQGSGDRRRSEVAGGRPTLAGRDGGAD